MRTLRIYGLLIVGLALPASAQQFPSCPISTGPDVIVGDVTSVQNYNLSGGIDAVALGTESCNIGTTNLNWVAGSVNHPLMGGTMYKAKAVSGSMRFEQIGVGWLKHAFAAFQRHLCCSTCPPGNENNTFSFLGVGCSDPYTANRNGTQNTLGPRFEVNSNTGVYDNTPSSLSSTTANNGRCQMLPADLEPSSASVRYFGEVMYLALDDARANNNDNNSSWREMTVTSGSTSQGFNFATAGTTSRMEVALQAWPLVDANAIVTTVITPEDSVAPYDGTGKLVVGCSVTNLGGGQWHYEYAVHNMNSDRAVAQFRVPAGPGVTVTNIGFHDVVYRANDGVPDASTTPATRRNYDGTDWPGSKSATEVSWATTPFATSDNANAVRFGTTYNFRFDANIGPVSGSITLGQYKVVNDVVVSGMQVPGDPAAFEAFCTNGSLGADHTTACPCGNTGAAGNGCGHSFDANGANLSATGTASADDVILTSTFEPATSFTLFLQHDASGDQVFHDGVLCAGGSLIRLRGRAAAGGTALFPDSTFANDATLTLSQRGGVTVGSGARRYYSAWFRNASTTFCPPATANVSNGWKIDW